MGLTEDELVLIKEHIEVHARRELRAVKITEVLRKAVKELERIKELERSNENLVNQSMILIQRNAELEELIRSLK